MGAFAKRTAASRAIEIGASGSDRYLSLFGMALATAIVLVFVGVFDAAHNGGASPSAMASQR